MQTNFLSQVKFKQTFNFRPDSDKIIFKLDSHKLYFNFPFTSIKKEKKNKKKQHFSSDQIQTNFISGQILVPSIATSNIITLNVTKQFKS
jgi:hypothetical protein